MQIDFHHGVTYVVARLAGMKHDEAKIIAHCAQYVDDATNHGHVRFDNGATYSRIATAHKMLDYSNFSELANHKAWVPFHFLPGNNLKKAGEENVSDRFIRRLICKPGSYVAHDMVNDCITDKRRPYSLHRLGITMHVYIDTWAHYGFCGTTHPINRATKIKVLDHNGSDIDAQKMTDRIKGFFKGIFDNAASDFVDDVQPLGHGAVLSYPDQPYLKWSYINGLGEEIIRDNPTDFIHAIEAMHAALVRYQAGKIDADVDPIGNEDMEKIKYMITNINDDDGEKRHKQWLKAIADGEFSFGKQQIEYIAKGEGSWKHIATGTKERVDARGAVFEYKESFLTSDWKMFHDAAQVHRFNVLHNILPRYGICVG